MLRSPLLCCEVPRHWVRGPDVSKHRNGLIFFSQISVNGYFDFWMLQHYIVSSSGTPVTSEATLHPRRTYWSIPWSRVLEKLTGPQLVKKFPTHYGTRSFITAVTSARHLSPSWDRSTPSMFPHITSWRSILILSSHIRLGLPSGLFPSRFPTETLCTALLSPISAKCPAHLIILDLITWTVLREEHRSSSQENGDLKVIYCSILSVNWKTFALCK